MTTYETTHNVDYITYSTSKFEPIDDMIGKPETIRPFIGNYKQAHKYECGLVVQWDDKSPRMKQHVTMSGKTLSKLREYGFTDIKIVEWLQSLKKPKFGRIDIAVTSHEINGKHGFTPEKAYKRYKAGKMVSEYDADKPIVDIEKNVETFYVGKRNQRDRLVRIYDKGLELGGTAGEIIRIELETRKYANTMAREIVEGRNIAGIIRRFVDYPTDKEWLKIMNSPVVPRLRVDIEPETDENKLEKQMDWLLNSVPQVIASVANGLPSAFDDDFFDRFAKRVAYHYNKLSS